MKLFSSGPMSGRRPASPAESLKRWGIAATELAVLSPLLAMLLVGMIELSRGVMARETLSNAARKGCRTGIQATATSTDIYNDTLNIMRDNGYDSTKFSPAAPGTTATNSNIGSITITVTDPNGNTLSNAFGAPTGSQVSVQVSIPVSSVTWLTSYYLKTSVIESGTIIMMKQ